jgi:hypothetical protein
MQSTPPDPPFKTGPYYVFPFPAGPIADFVKIKKESKNRSSSDPINGELILVQFRMNFGKSLLTISNKNYLTHEGSGTGETRQYDVCIRSNSFKKPKISWPAYVQQRTIKRVFHLS